MVSFIARFLILCIHLYYFCYSLDVNKHKIVCYYDNRARGHSAEYKQEYYTPGLCTHLVYGFAKISRSIITGEFEIVPEYQEELQSGYKQMTFLKTKDPELKTLLAVNSWRKHSMEFFEMTETEDSIKHFSNFTKAFLRSNHFDGIVLHWEYPGHAVPSWEGRKQFLQLCREMKREFEREGLIVSATVTGKKDISRKVYRTKQLGKCLDIVNIMSFEYLPTSNVTYHPTGLKDVKESIRYWVNQGIPSEKITLGLASYGRAFNLLDRCSNALGAKTLDMGFPIAYNHICRKSWKSRTCTKQNTISAPFGYDIKHWIGYDDEESIMVKVTKIVKPKMLGGIMFWALNFDDYDQKCGHGEFVLLKAAKRALNGKKTVFDKCRDVTNNDCSPNRKPTSKQTTIPEDIDTTTSMPTTTEGIDTTTSTLMPTEGMNTTTSEPTPTKEIDITTTEPIPTEEIDITSTEPTPTEEINITTTEPTPTEEIDIATTEPTPTEEINITTTEPTPTEEINITTTEPTPTEEIDIATTEPTPTEEINITTTEPTPTEEIDITTTEPTPTEEINITTTEPTLTEEIDTTTTEPIPTEEIDITTTEPTPTEEINITTTEPTPTEDIDLTTTPPFEESLTTTETSITEPSSIEHSLDHPLTSITTNPTPTTGTPTPRKKLTTKKAPELDELTIESLLEENTTQSPPREDTTESSIEENTTLAPTINTMIKSNPTTTQKTTTEDELSTSQPLTLTEQITTTEPIDMMQTTLVPPTLNTRETPLTSSSPFQTQYRFKSTKFTVTSPITIYEKTTIATPTTFIEAIETTEPTKATITTTCDDQLLVSTTVQPDITSALETTTETTTESTSRDPMAGPPTNPSPTNQATLTKQTWKEQTVEQFTTISTSKQTEETYVCLMPRIGHRTNCRLNKYGPLGVYKGLDKYCTIVCKFDEDCCRDICCCQELIDKKKTILDQPQKKTILVESKEKKKNRKIIKRDVMRMSVRNGDKKNACTLPRPNQTGDVRQCKRNTNGLFGYIEALDEWCQNSCRSGKKCCPSKLCCCE